MEYIVKVINMSATKLPSPYRKYDDSMWITYINEAIQSGKHKRYCEQHNIIYRTFQRKYPQYQQSSDKENWSPKSKRRLSHCVFTDSTEKEAVEQYETQYDNINKPRDSTNLAVLLMMIHNRKYPENAVLDVSSCTLNRIKQQHNMTTERATTRKSTMMNVDDTVIQDFQTSLNDAFIN